LKWIKEINMVRSHALTRRRPSIGLFSLVLALVLSACSNTPSQPAHTPTAIAPTPAPQTWNLLGQKIAPRVGGLIIQPGSGDVMIAYGDQEAFKSLDQGQSWTPLAGFAALQTTAQSMVFSPVDKNTLYACDMNTVYKSTDLGENWKAISNEIKGLRIGTPLCQVLVPDPSSASTLYMGTSSGLFSSTDGGVNWNPFSNALGYTQAVAVDPNNPVMIYAGDFDGLVMKSTDSGKTWKNLDILEMRGYQTSDLAIDEQNPDNIYLAYNGGVLRSTNAGRTWSKTNLPNQMVWSLAVAPTNPPTLYAGAQHGIYASVNGGESWNKIGDPAGGIIPSPQDPSKIYMVGGPESWIYTNK
jgi:hypothetical protein